MAASVAQELEFGGAGGPVDSLADCLRPAPVVLVVQPQHAAPLLPGSSILASICCLLCLSRGVIHVTDEVLSPINLNLQPPLVCAAWLAAQQCTEIKSAVGAVEHLGLSDQQLHPGLCPQQLFSMLGKE